MAKKRLELEKARADPRHTKMILLIEQCVDERIETLIEQRKSETRKKATVKNDDDGDDDDVGVADDGYWII